MKAYSPTDLILRMDWALVREQKTYCLNEAANRPDAAPIYEGLVALLDNLQSVAEYSALVPLDLIYGTPWPTGTS